MLHTHARSKHPKYDDRCEVPDHLVPWEVQWDDYNPPEFTHVRVSSNLSGHADPDHVEADVIRSRPTFSVFQFADGKPLNPRGRTGMKGRGIIAKWGPNQAADPIVTRLNPTTGKLEMVAIQRRDTQDWAIPGGKVDPGEEHDQTLRREFHEEALASNPLCLDLLDKVFQNGTVIYEGYVDDPRNTDNAWMETVAKHFHISEEVAEALPLYAADDAKDVQWLCLEDNEEQLSRLYASHATFVREALRRWKEERA
eukprot:c5571_g1_i1.p1 GENE.c5571_g1_i1~~c5571_g1_i1.p1  ORF type:complete len:254 (+),score=60.82 c5571_g1_i1:45-806(+)